MDFMLKHNAEYEILEESQYTRIRFKIRVIDFERYFNDFTQADVLSKEEAGRILTAAEETLGAKVVSDFSLDRHSLNVRIVKTEKTDLFVSAILNLLQKLYEENEVHITRMFGSFVYLKRIDGQLTAIHATPIPIQYCPLIAKLLTEIGGETATQLLAMVAKGAPDSAALMCELINEVVIKGGYFDTSRPLNSCELNVLFGASETMSSAFKAGLIDAAVIVSNNLGTIITTNQSNTQGAVKRMTGLFATSPSKELLDTAAKACIIPVFPHTATIDQLEGVKKAIALGYTKIAVSVAWQDNSILAEIDKLQANGITIYKFALCSTGLKDEVAGAIMKYADLVWACSSLAVKKYIEPNAVAQVGLKIPVYILTENGWSLVKNHLCELSSRRGQPINLDSVELIKGQQRTVIYNDAGHFTASKKDSLQPCTDCPYPCI
jgi:putative methanogenesis marker protein 8